MTSAVQVLPGAGDIRGKIIDALMGLAAERRFEDIAIRDICAAAGIGLADFRDAYPSKGAILAGLSRRIDRAVLDGTPEAAPGESARERLFDILMRRFDAMAPYRDALREITAWLRRDPSAALAMNPIVANSMRFMLEAAEIDCDGASGALKLQGLVFAWARVVSVWLDDDDPGFSKTMAELDKELTRGERAVAGVERLEALTSPLKALARAALESRQRWREGGRRRPREDEDVAAQDSPADEERPTSRAQDDPDGQHTM